MTEAFLRLHIHGMIRCCLLALEELFTLYLDMQTRNSCQIWIWVSSVSTEIFLPEVFLGCFSITLLLLNFLDRENEAGRFILKTTTRNVEQYKAILKRSLLGRIIRKMICKPVKIYTV